MFSAIKPTDFLRKHGSFVVFLSFVFLGFTIFFGMFFFTSQIALGSCQGNADCTGLNRTIRECETGTSYTITPIEGRCNTQTGDCYERRGTSIYDDCADGYVCQGEGQCVPGPCTDDSDCANLNSSRRFCDDNHFVLETTTGRCDVDTGQCFSDTSDTRTNCWQSPESRTFCDGGNYLVTTQNVGVCHAFFGCTTSWPETDRQRCPDGYTCPAGAQACVRIQPTITASLSASPTSGTTQQTFTFTVESIGGTATGDIAYSTPLCGRAGTLVSGSYTGNTDSDFQCTYSTAGGSTAQITVTREGVSATPTASVTVTAPPTITASLEVVPMQGLTGQQFNFTATRTGGTATGTVTFTNPQCGTGGALVLGSYTGSADNAFQCTYATAESRTARITVSQGGATTTPTAQVNVYRLISNISSPTWVRQDSPFSITVPTTRPSTCTLTPTNESTREPAQGTTTKTTFRGVRQTTPVIYNIECTYTPAVGDPITDRETRRINVLPRFREF